MFEYILIIDSSNTRIKFKTRNEMFDYGDLVPESVSYECRFIK